MPWNKMDRINAFYKSPIGIIEIIGNKTEIVAVDFVKIQKTAVKSSQNIPVTRKCIKQLDEYFSGKRKKFDLRFEFFGTDFQKKVWIELTKIPYGKTVSYKYIAEKIGNPKAYRAVGGAINKNKIVIIVPCHRVIGSNGRLIGFAGGLWRKKWLTSKEKIALINEINHKSKEGNEKTK